MFNTRTLTHTRILNTHQYIPLIIIKSSRVHYTRIGTQHLPAVSNVHTRRSSFMRAASIFQLRQQSQAHWYSGRVQSPVSRETPPELVYSCAWKIAKSLKFLKSWEQCDVRTSSLPQTRGNNQNGREFGKDGVQKGREWRSYWDWRGMRAHVFLWFPYPVARCVITAKPSHLMICFKKFDLFFFQFESIACKPPSRPIVNAILLFGWCTGTFPLNSFWSVS